MSAFNTEGFVAQAVISCLLAFLAYRLIAKTLQGVLSRTLRMPEGTDFYLRVLLIVLLCESLSNCSLPDLKPDAHFIEYVWNIAGVAAKVLQDMGWILLSYAALVTVMIVVLKPQNER